MKSKINLSATAKIHAKVLERKSQNLPVYDFSIGEPDLPIHPLIEGFVSAKLKQEKALYPALAGFSQLRAAAAKWMNQFYSCDYDIAEALIVSGAKFGLYLLLQRLVQAGDEVIIPVPYWVSYVDMTKLNDATPVLVETKENNWKLTPELFLQNITKKTKIVLINNPGNPSSSVYSKFELEKILRIAYENNILVIADEVYSGLMYQDQNFVSCGAFPQYKKNVLVLQSCSKNFAMTGWRVGFIFGDEDLLASLIPAISQTTSGVPAICQWAALAALENAQVIMESVKIAMKQRRDILINQLRKLSINAVSPSAGLYLFLPLSQFTDEKNSEKFCLNYLDTRGIAMIPGSAFGKEGFVRLSFGSENSTLSKIELEKPSV